MVRCSLCPFVGGAWEVAYLIVCEGLIDVNGEIGPGVQYRSWCPGQEEGCMFPLLGCMKTTCLLLSIVQYHGSYFVLWRILCTASAFVCLAAEATNKINSSFRLGLLGSALVTLLSTTDCLSITHFAAMKNIQLRVIGGFRTEKSVCMSCHGVL